MDKLQIHLHWPIHQPSMHITWLSSNCSYYGLLLLSNLFGGCFSTLKLSISNSFWGNLNFSLLPSRSKSLFCVTKLYSKGNKTELFFFFFYILVKQSSLGERKSRKKQQISGSKIKSVFLRYDYGWEMDKCSEGLGAQWQVLKCQNVKEINL